MPRSRSRLPEALGLLLLGVAPGCTLLAGQPWGLAELSLDVTLDVDEGRLTEGGLLKTSRDFALDPERLELGLGSLRLIAEASASASSTGAVFDPADPPAGYSLCHNGHCHADSGALVAYEDIRAELAGGGGATATVVAARAILSSPLPLWPDVGDVALDECANGCQLDDGTLAEAAVGVTGLSFRARVFDLRPADRARLPPEGVLVEADVPASLLLAAPLEEGFSRSEPLGLRVDATATFEPTFFDGIDFDQLVPADPDPAAVYDLSDALSVVEAVATHLEEDGALTLVVERFEPPLAEQEVVLLPKPVDP